MATHKRRKIELTEQPQGEHQHISFGHPRPHAPKGPALLSAKSAFALKRQIQLAKDNAGGKPGGSQNSTSSDQSHHDGWATASADPEGRVCHRRERKPPQTLVATSASSPSHGHPAVPRPPVAESKEKSECDDLGPESRPRKEALPLPQLVFSRFSPSSANFKKRAGGKIQLKLCPGERIVVLGSYGIRVTNGSITLNGALLTPSERTYSVFSPHCHALPAIRCSGSSDPARMELLPLPVSEGIRKLACLSPHFRRIWNEQDLSVGRDEKNGAETFEILYTSADGPSRAGLQNLVTPPEWRAKSDSLMQASHKKPVSVMITGPRSSGKSTFGRILANQLLTDPMPSGKTRRAAGVAVLDLDPAQPELCVAGQVALAHVTEPLLSPSFCRPLPTSGIKVVRSHTLASMTPGSDPELYIAAAADLFNHYRNRLRTCPLVINTPGWVQGTGLDLLLQLIGRLLPTAVVYMSLSDTTLIEEVKSLQDSCSSCKMTSFSRLPSQSSQYVTRTAAQLRTMQTMSYFHAESQSPAEAESSSRWNPNPLTTVPPWRVNYSGPGAGILGIMCYDYQVPPELLAEAINGTIVAVVEVENPKAFRDSLVQSSRISGDDFDRETDGGGEDTWSFDRIRNRFTMATPQGLPLLKTCNTLRPEHSQALGLALVRGIDIKSKVLQLITPISAERVHEINGKGGQIVLVSGKFDPPSWAYTEDLHHHTHRDGDVEAGSVEQSREMEVEDSMESDADIDEVDDVPSAMTPPWIELLQGNEKRGVGSRVWRVRRDLGRGANGGD